MGVQVHYQHQCCACEREAVPARAAKPSIRAFLTKNARIVVEAIIEPFLKGSFKSMFFKNTDQ
eukprot:2697615-Alexandrium_andersonii.AAC.1